MRDIKFRAWYDLPAIRDSNVCRWRSVDDRAGRNLTKKSGGSVSQAQKEWGEVLQASGIPHKVCRGAMAAIEFIKECQEYYKMPDDVPGAVRKRG